jgi:hypothetical protein
MTWAEWYESHREDCQVKLTRVGPYFVSTIFLAVDLGFFQGESRLFETMVWVNPDDRQMIDEQTRCATWLEAEAMHQKMIDKLKESSDDLEELWPLAVDLEILLPSP